MTDVTLREAWAAWFVRLPLADFSVWGIPISWLGRAGVVADFLSSILIMSDWIGRARIRRCGRWIRRRLASERSVALFLEATKRAVAWRRIRQEDFDAFPEYWASLEKVAHVDVLVQLALIALPCLFLPHAWPFWIRLLIGFATMALVYVRFGHILVFGVMMYIAGSWWVVDVVLVRPLSWLLERRYLYRWVRLFAVILMLVGFHFILLAM